MMAARAMSTKKRTFLALGGVVFPNVGDGGLYFAALPPGARFASAVAERCRNVVVLRVSKSGETIWTRFSHPDRFGAGIHEWRRVRNGHYARSKDPKGAVRF